MGRPPLDKKQRQLPVAFPDDIRWVLELSAQAGKRSLAAEIRRRILRTVEEDGLSPVMRELREGLVNIESRLVADFGKAWHLLPRAHEAFAAAVAQRIAAYRPEPSSTYVEGGIVKTFDIPPKAIGRMREVDDQREEHYPYLKAAAAKRRPAGRTVRGRRKLEDSHD